MEQLKNFNLHNLFRQLQLSDEDFFRNCSQDEGSGPKGPPFGFSRKMKIFSKFFFRPGSIQLVERKRSVPNLGDSDVSKCLFQLFKNPSSALTRSEFWSQIAQLYPQIDDLYGDIVME